MTRAKQVPTLRRRVIGALGAPRRWWSGLTPPERVIYRTSLLFAIGFGLVALPLAFIAPASFWALLILRRAA